jgi:hypothetical protein
VAGTTSQGRKVVDLTARFDGAGEVHPSKPAEPAPMRVVFIWCRGYLGQRFNRRAFPAVTEGQQLAIRVKWTSPDP